MRILIVDASRINLMVLQGNVSKIDGVDVSTFSQGEKLACIRSLGAGASDPITKPIAPVELKPRRRDPMLRSIAARRDGVSAAPAWPAISTCSPGRHDAPRVA